MRYFISNKYGHIDFNIWKESYIFRYVPKIADYKLVLQLKSCWM